MTRRLILVVLFAVLAEPVSAQDWQPVTEALILAEKPGFGKLCGVVVDHMTGELTINLSDKGLYKSSDAGKTWQVTLLGDAAHPMYPRGSNGAGQAIVDARFLAGEIKRRGATIEALQGYEAVRRPATSQVVLTNRSDPPDAILREVWNRSGGRRFERIEDLIPTDELQGILDRYKKVAGFDIETLKSRPSFV